MAWLTTQEPLRDDQKHLRSNETAPQRYDRAAWLLHIRGNMPDGLERHHQ